MFFSLQDVTVILNGHTVDGEQIIRGWSEDTDALTLPDAFEFASVRRGATGDMAAFSTGDRGGPVTLKLLPNSPSVPFFMTQVTRILVERAVVIWDGSVNPNPPKDTDGRREDSGRVGEGAIGEMAGLHWGRLEVGGRSSVAA